MEFREFNEFKEFKQMVLQGERKQNKGGISTITIPAKYRSILGVCEKEKRVWLFLGKHNRPNQK